MAECIPAGCGSLDNWSVIISAHELHGISVCNCDKIGSSNNLDLDAEGNVDSAVTGDIRGYILFFLCYFQFFHHESWKITCKYWQACIASIDMRESPSRNYIENQGTYFLITLFLSYLRSTPGYASRRAAQALLYSGDGEFIRGGCEVSTILNWTMVLGEVQDDTGQKILNGS